MSTCEPMFCRSDMNNCYLCLSCYFCLSCQAVRYGLWERSFCNPYINKEISFSLAAQVPDRSLVGDINWRYLDLFVVVSFLSSYIYPPASTHHWSVEQFVHNVTGVRFLLRKALPFPLCNCAKISLLAKYFTIKSHRRRETCWRQFTETSFGRHHNYWGCSRSHSKWYLAGLF